ncbi:hypothetical protein sos41_18490 [Alphaproteobacteria bacterium SO-S41]|nr:hypothetical protein sos41_18490 [Alphaproteobacteria bacterium SO-S41]
MPKMIFVNLPVKDLKASIAFFDALGFSFNPQFTDETATCMVISDTIFAMLLTHDKYRQFTKKEIADATKVSEVLTCLSTDSRDEVNAMVDKAIAAGGTEPRAAQDMGFMFNRSFDDLDGHTWEIMWMDPAAVQPT